MTESNRNKVATWGNPSSGKTAYTALVFGALLSAVSCGSTEPFQKKEPVAEQKPETAPSPVVKSPADRWTVDESVNELDHTRKLTLYDGELYLRCLPRFQGYIVPDLPDLGHRLDSDVSHEQLIRFRIDDGSIRSEWWTVSDDFEALFLPTGTLRKVIRAKKLVIEYKPDYVQRRTMTLDLSGLAEAAKRAACKV